MHPAPPISPGLVSVQGLHTFGLKAHAQAVRVMHSMADVHAFAQAVRSGQPVVLLGGGSNTVFMQDLPNTTVWCMALKGIVPLGQDAGHTHVRVMAGEAWHHWVEYSVARGWYGLENLALIPGTVGAAPVQNIGAYGVELAQHVHRVHVWDTLHNRAQAWSAAQCAFAYRDSIFKHSQPQRWVITAVDFALPQVWQPVLHYGDLAARVQAMGPATPQRVLQTICAVRAAKLPNPAVLGNSGSFFKNPVVPLEQAQALLARFPGLVHYPVVGGEPAAVKLAAGWLIEHCGLKGLRLGPVGVYSQQALVLVNHGGATGADLNVLVQHVQATVQAKFGVWLDVEPVIHPAPEGLFIK